MQYFKKALIKFLNRNSRSVVSYKIVLRNFGFLQKTPGLKSHLNNAAALPVCNFIKKGTPTKVFSCDFCEIFQDSFSAEHLRTTVSDSRFSYFLLLQALKSLRYIFKLINIRWKPLCDCGTTFYLKLSIREENREDLIKSLVFPSKSRDLSCWTFQMNVTEKYFQKLKIYLTETKQMLTVCRRLRFQLVDMHLFFLKLIIRVFQRISKIWIDKLYNH